MLSSQSRRLTDDEDETPSQRMTFPKVLRQISVSDEIKTQSW